MPRAVEPAPEPESLGPPPRANPDLVGHEHAERELERLWRLGRLPHAILLGGPRGIGKATLAFRFARFLLAQGGQDGGADARLLGAATRTGLATDPESGVFRRVAAGGHADLLTIERGWDPRRRRLRGEIVVEDTREVAAFFRLTAAEEGWRVVIVDGAEEMNRNAANAVLKILEEPPARALLLLVSHSPGQLLPTIRSRCRRLSLAPPAPSLAAELVRRYRPQLDEGEAESLAAVCAGSIGRALDLADNGGLGLYRSLIELLLPSAIDVGGLHGFADRLARADAVDAYSTGVELLLQSLARMAVGAARCGLVGDEIVAGERAAMTRLVGRADPARWAELHAEIEQKFAAVDELNLDRKQAILGAFFAIANLSR